MAKGPVLDDVTNILTAAVTINANNGKIEDAFENTMSLDGSTPNALEADLDLNSNNILNVTNIDAISMSVGGVPLDSSGTAFNSEAEFNASSVTGLESVSVLISNERVFYQRFTGTVGPEDLVHTDLSKWQKTSTTGSDILAATTDAINGAEFIVSTSGVFTPTLELATVGDSTFTGGTVKGRYNRIGNLIFVDASFSGVTYANTTGSGAVLLADLPFTSGLTTYNTLSVRASTGINWDSATAEPPASVSVRVVANSDKANLSIDPADAATFNLASGRLASSLTLEVYGFYEVDS